MGIATLLSESRQLTVLDAAEKFANQQLSPSFADVRAAFAKIKVDIAAECRALLAIVGAARNTHALRNMHQKQVEAEALELQAGVEKADAWIDDLGDALGWARVQGHPLAERLSKVLLEAELPGDTHRQTMAEILQMILTAEEEGGLEGLPLPDDFLEEGRAIIAAMKQDKSESARAEAGRKAATVRLRVQLDEIERILMALEAVRGMASRRGKMDIPGFDFSLLKADVATPGASSSTDDAAAPLAPYSPSVT